MGQPIKRLDQLEQTPTNLQLNRTSQLLSWFHSFHPLPHLLHFILLYKKRRGEKKLIENHHQSRQRARTPSVRMSKGTRGEANERANNRRTGNQSVMAHGEKRERHSKFVGGNALLRHTLVILCEIKQKNEMNFVCRVNYGMGAIERVGNWRAVTMAFV
jgi:hypothetical protein